MKPLDYPAATVILHIMTPRQSDYENIRIVLVEPKVPGNVGAAARAMKNMGLSRLVLVRPWFHGHPQARYMAHCSEDVLDRAEVFDSLADAVADSVLVAGTTRRRRSSTPYTNPRTAAQAILESAVSGPVSILFGREDRGLLNEELKLCQLLIDIPTSPAQPSLNLSQAVMVIAYELFAAEHPGPSSPLDLARSEEIEIMYAHLAASLETLGFREWNDGENYMKSLRRTFSRTRLEHRDTASIHKLCGEIDRFASRVRDELRHEAEAKARVAKDEIAAPGVGGVKKKRREQ
jgi:tRNA (cytidine32/uridine32-2'-O)-methyltransferase